MILRPYYWLLFFAVAMLIEFACAWNEPSLLWRCIDCASGLGCLWVVLKKANEISARKAAANENDDDPWKD